MIRKLSTIFLTLAIFIFAFPPVANAADTVREIIFPILNGVTYTDDFGVPRVGGRTHEGNDLMAPKMRPLVAVVDGIVSFITTNEETWGYSLTIVDEDGYKYNYLHMNNDTPGTDDGKGGYKNAFAQDIELGSKVIAGQLIGYVGDSGNAETIAPHLHFEIRTDSDRAINPYPSLQASKVISKAVTNENPEIVEVETLEPSKEPLDKPTVNTPEEIIPYDLFEGGANISSGNIDKDTDPEFVVGTAFAGGGRTIIKEFDSDGDLLKEFFAYGDVFRGGVDVASADMDGDGLSEIITAPGPGAGTRAGRSKLRGPAPHDPAGVPNSLFPSFANRESEPVRAGAVRLNRSRVPRISQPDTAACEAPADSPIAVPFFVSVNSPFAFVF